MKIRNSVLVTFGALALSVGVANAASFKIEAISNASLTGFFSNTSFTIVFSDADGDDLFDLDELTAFSGLVFPNITLYPYLISAAYVPGVSESSIAPKWPSWYFGTDPCCANAGLPNTFYDYVKSEVSAVPLPSSMTLVVAGLGGLALTRRRRRG